MDENGDETTQELHFFYDADKMLSMIESGDEKYRILQNAQGDIIGLIDNNNELIVEYKYDLWGGVVMTTYHSNAWIGELNPFRYRGYVFDSDTNLYYLDERYYNQDIGRFVNSDWVFIFTVTEASELLKHNLFAYCKNNPIMEYDPLGIWSWKSICKVALTAVAIAGAVVIAAASGGTALAIAAGVTMGCSTVDGMLSAKAAGGRIEDGALAGACGGLAALATGTVTNNPVYGRATSSLTYDLVYEKLADGSIDPEDIALTAVDVGLDCVMSGMYYGGVNDFKTSVAKDLTRGLLDTGADVVQTTRIYNHIPKGKQSSTSATKTSSSTTYYQRYGGVRNMKMEIAFMQG